MHRKNPQEFDFEVKYVKGENHEVPYTLSRDGQEESLKVQRIKEGIAKRYIKDKDSINYWRLDSGKVKQILEEKDRGIKIEDRHIELHQRGAHAVYYNLKKNWYWKEWRM